jgi:hypothetical protein
MFSIDWNFLTSRGELESACIEEIANDLLYDRAYPEIKGGVRNFIRSYAAVRGGRHSDNLISKAGTRRAEFSGPGREDGAYLRGEEGRHAR